MAAPVPVATMMSVVVVAAAVAAGPAVVVHAALHFVPGLW